MGHRVDDSGRRRGTVGLIVNPIAGMGGRVGLGGTDGDARLRRARELGAEPAAPRLAALALGRLAPLRRRLTVLAAPGPMGAEVSAGLGFATTVLGAPPAGATSAADSRAAATAIAAAGADLLLFAGGDGTARDIHDALDATVPVLGVPAGVKMYSGVFARNAAAAGDAALDFLSAPGPGRLRAAEVVDVDEDADTAGRVRLYGELRVPAERSRLLAAKSRGTGDAEADLDRLAAAVVAEMEPGRLYLLGPGTTIGRIKERLGIGTGPLSVDAVRDRAMVGSGLGEAGLLALLAEHPRATALLGVVGGQGSLLGRGNQQLSAAVLRRLGADNLTVLAAAGKLLALQPQRLHVDTGDPEVDRMLSGYRRVRVAPGRTIVIEVGT